jgi:hypothetical protein
MEPISRTRKTVLGTFLESVAAADAPNPPPTPAQEAARPAPPAPPAAGAAEPPTLSTVLRYLLSTGEAGQEVTIPDVAAGLKATTVETADVVQRMAYSGLVTVDGDPGREFIHLTDQGRGLTSVA